MSSAPSPCDRQQVLGMPVDVCPDVLAAAVELHRNGGGQLVTLNAEMTMTALAQPELGQAIRAADLVICLLYTSPSPRDKRQSRMPSSA